MNLILETDRLLLREIRLSDAEDMFRLDSSPNVVKYLGNNPVKSIEESVTLIEMIRNQYIQNGIGRFAVVLKESNEFIGWCGIKFLTEPENNYVNVYEIGYRLIEEHWGKGFGFEAAKAWLDYGFNTMKVKTMYASVHKENAASKRILEKLGLQITSEFLWREEIPCYWLELENKSIS
jgi:RimJ/RimL family protein N-acetyltransferase